MTASDEHEGKGGSYLLDPKTGKRTLVQRTEDPNGDKPHDESAKEIAEAILRGATLRRTPDSKGNSSARLEFISETGFGIWWRAFLQSKAGKAALANFDAKRIPKRRRTVASVRGDGLTLLRLARACYGASCWQRGADPGIVYRGKLAHARREREKFAGHASALAQAFKGEPPGLQWALWDAARVAKVGNLLEEKRNTTDVFVSFFEELARRLRAKNRLPEIDGGPFLYRSTYGNLVYERNAPKRPPALETMLAFELVMALRLWSAGHGADLVQIGQGMPAFGKPCYGVAAAFVNAALGTNRRITGAEIANRLKRMPRGIGLFLWPKDG